MSSPFPSPPRYGVYLTPDTLPLTQEHFRRAFEQALPLGLHWVVFTAPLTRAIPEGQLRPWLEQGTEVVVHLQGDWRRPPAAEEVRPLLAAYARWGVRYLIWLDRPNVRAAWGAEWPYVDPATRAADVLLPLLQAARAAGLVSLLPPLAQGGDYWDTAFLRRLLEALQRRAPDLLAEVGLAVEARTFGRPLHWGQGGPEAWPEAAPYHTPPQSQDQRGFCAFDWYATISRAVVGRALPMFLVRMGPTYAEGDEEEVTQQILSIAALMGGAGEPPEVALHPAVFGGTFWALTAAKASPHAQEVWLPPEGEPRPVMRRLRPPGEGPEPKGNGPRPGVRPNPYVLLPPDAALIPWALELARPLLLYLRATVGFSWEEAARARRVLVIGGPEVFPEAELEPLRRRGVRVQRVQTGTDVATLLADRIPQPREVNHE